MARRGLTKKENFEELDLLVKPVARANILAGARKTIRTIISVPKHQMPIVARLLSAAPFAPF